MTAYRDPFEYDPEGPSDDDLERFGSEYITCPHCGEDVYDQIDVCPNCLKHVGMRPKSNAVWITLGGIALVAILILVGISL